MRSRIVTVALLSMLLALLGPAAFAQEAKPSSDPGSEPVVTGTVEPYFGELQVTNSSVSVNGKAADTAPAGSDFKLVLTIGNSSDKPARNISMKIDEIPSYITLTDTSPPVSDLAAGDTTTVTVNAHAGETGCEDFAAFGASFDSSLGKSQTKFGIQMACPGARVSVESVEYRGGDGDGVPEPGERVQIFVTLRNTGRDAATSVHATMKQDNKDITVVDSTSAWQDIPGGATAVAASPFVIDIAADAKRQESGCSGIGGGPMPVETAPPPSGGSGGSSGSGQSEPGATGSGDAVTSTPADSTQPAPGQVEPAPPAPDQSVDPSATPEPTPDNPVAFDATMSIAASDKTFDGAFSTQTVCMYAGMEKGGPNPVPPASDSGGVQTASRQEKTAASAPERTPLMAIAAVLMVAAGAGVLRRKFWPTA